mgnify:CR=1 FL=1
MFKCIFGNFGNVQGANVPATDPGVIGVEQWGFFTVAAMSLTGIPESRPNGNNTFYENQNTSAVWTV